ncbi:MAG: hypothetical protein EXS08_07435 [Planctomycetes bacterium]|nr:hypothetical protein [Planctomycetota bacterium]
MNGPLRWFSLSLVALGCAAALLTFRALSTSTERGLTSPVETEALAEVAPARQEPSAVEGSLAAAQREALAAPEIDAQLAVRVQDVTDQLAQALSAP